MNHKKVMLCGTLLLGFGLTGLHAQEATVASGGDAFGSGGSASYSIGQLHYTTNMGTDASVAQGVQQAFEISIVVGIHEDFGINLVMIAYPNPTTDFLTLEVENFQNEHISYQLRDLNGKLLESRRMTNQKTHISLKNLDPAIYFLEVIINQKEVKTFKITKN